MNGPFRRMPRTASLTDSQTLAIGALVALLVTSTLGCTRCDGPTMPTEPASPSAASMDAVDDQLNQMQNNHEQSRKTATPSSSLLSDTGIDPDTRPPRAD